MSHITMSSLPEDQHDIEDSVVIHPLYYFDFVTFKVENTLFRVPRHAFIMESTVFQDMFLLPQNYGETPEGISEEKPITLSGIKTEEFVCLLQVLYPKPSLLHSVCPRNLGLSEDAWVSILKLSNMWGFQTIKELAVQNLVGTSSVKKLHLAYIYDIEDDEWIRPALLEILNRRTPLSEEEGKSIGIAMLTKVMRYYQCGMVEIHKDLIGSHKYDFWKKWEEKSREAIYNSPVLPSPAVTPGSPTFSDVNSHFSWRTPSRSPSTGRGWGSTGLSRQ